MNKDDITKYLQMVGQELAVQGKHLEIVLLGGAAIGFTYNFKRQPDKQLWQSFPGLDVYVVSLDYLFVTKIMASRYKDRQDIQALASRLKITRRKDVLALVTTYVASEDISAEVLDEIAYLFET